MPISVPKKFLSQLKAALDAREHPAEIFGATAMYNFVHDHLKRNGVTPTVHSDTSTVPDDHSHWVPK